MAHVHTAALEVIDAVVGSEAVGGGDSLHASDNGLIGFLARVDIDAVAFGVVVVLKEREGEERVWRIVVAQVVERRALHIDAAHAFYQAVARRQYQHAAALPVGERRVALLYHGVLRAKVGVAHMRVVVIEDVFALLVRRVNVARLGKGSTVAVGIGQHATALTAHGEKVFVGINLLIRLSVQRRLASTSVASPAMSQKIQFVGFNVIRFPIVGTNPLAIAMRNTQKIIACEEQLAIYFARIKRHIGRSDPFNSRARIGTDVAPYALGPIFLRVTI